MNERLERSLYRIGWREIERTTIPSMRQYGYRVKIVVYDNIMDALSYFKENELAVVSDAISLAEELTFNDYKISANEWKRHRYDIKTLIDLKPEEIVAGPFAQIIRYEGRKVEDPLASSHYDFYKICLQDHAILRALDANKALAFLPFVLYIVTHELIHIVRFSKFLQNFEASLQEKLLEESRVHEKTRAILQNVSNVPIEPVFAFYRAWEKPIDDLRDV